MNSMLKRLLEAIRTLPDNPSPDQLQRIKTMTAKMKEAPDNEHKLLNALKPFAKQGVNGDRLVNDVDYERAVRTYELIGGK